MAEYKITIDKKVIAILGPHLYGDTASIIAELISNSYDADADNCWITIKTGKTPEIIIEDDGIGMTPDDVNNYFLDIGYDRRNERPVTVKGRKVFGRKGIGKLAAFSLSKMIELYSLKAGKKAGCILDYDKITLENKDPEAIPDDKIMFAPEKLSKTGTGTRIVLKNIQKNVNTTYYYLINRIIRNFNMDLTKFKIHMIKNDEAPKTIDYSNLNFFYVMDTIVTIGHTFKDKGDAVKGNMIQKRYKMITSYEELSKENGNERKVRFAKLPARVTVLTKAGETKRIDFSFYGWIGTITDKEKLKGLVITTGASKQEKANISINDNRITIFSRDRIGEYDVLPKVQTNTIYDAYVIGEIHADIFEDDQLVDMAISNRRGYEETDERYRALLDCLKALVRFITQQKAELATKRKEDQKRSEDAEEAEQIKEEFIGKTKTQDILQEKLDDKEREIVTAENLQFVRATQLGRNTKKVMISHDSDNKQYGFFIVKIFELLGLDVVNTFIFTSNPGMGAPHGANIYDYLKSCFRDDIYVIFLFSRHFYDSNICIAETGAAWATNRHHSNIIIDIDYHDIDKPIDNALNGLSIHDLDTLNKVEMAEFIKTIFVHIGQPTPQVDAINAAIDQAIGEFQGKLSTTSFYPTRKYQGHPLCGEEKCGNTMNLTKDGDELYFQCTTPGCKKRLKAAID
jgi:hypothetical protein